jgi:hypothetical protein
MVRRPGSNPVREWTQFGQVDIDTLVPTVAPCSVTGNTVANLPATWPVRQHRVFQRY